MRFFPLFFTGWDETLLFWDLRVPQKENPISYIYGPLICGEALDVKGDYILTGSWRDKQQLEVWDMRKMQLLNSLEWTPQKTDDKSYIYSAQFSKLSQNYIIAGSSGASEIRIYQLRNEALYQYECVEILKDLTRSVYTIDFCHETNTFVYGDGNGKVGIVDIL
jgi:WD40 repeat protein